MKKTTKTVLVAVLGIGSAVICSAQDLTVEHGASFTIKSIADADVANYQWYMDGTPIVGANAASYNSASTLAPGMHVFIRTANLGDACGVRSSNAFTVKVPPPLPRLLHQSNLENWRIHLE
jgi:hypothetical protein